MEKENEIFTAKNKIQDDLMNARIDNKGGMFQTAHSWLKVGFGVYFWGKSSGVRGVPWLVVGVNLGRSLF